jgi:DNA-binding transcriptional regulator YbjK
MGLNSRGVETHRRIIDATLRVIATEGVRAVTHRRVAKEAGSATGLIAYYFASTPALIAGTLEELTRRETDRLDSLRDQVIATGGDVNTLVDLLVEELPRWSSDRKQDAISSMALTLEIPRSSISREAFADWEQAQDALYQAVAEQVGCSDHDALATYLAASLEGIAVYAAITSDPEDVERAARLGLRLLLTSARDHG